METYIRFEGSLSGAFLEGRSHMNNERTEKRKKVSDPHQRTFSGNVVHIIWRILCAVMVVVLTFGIIGGVAAERLYTKTMDYLMNDIKPNATYDLDGVKLNQSSFIYAKNPATGEYEELRQLLAIENRIWVSYEEIPRNMINATVAIEDKRFWEHDGVDWQRTLAASANMFLGGSTYGGSTLTQQLIKNLSGDKEVTVRRKLMEIFRAQDFESRYTKEQILEWYLNTIYLGEGAYGVKSAAHVYFGKELDELTAKECASLIGITNNPSLYDPYIYPENNERRTLTILQQMYEQGYIETEEEYDAISDQVLEFKSLSAGDRKFVCTTCGYEGTIRKYKADGDYYVCPICRSQNQFDVEKKNYYTYFEDTVIRDVTRDLAAAKGLSYEAASKLVTTGGFIIYSTIDLEAQAKMDEVYQNLENVPQTYSAQQLQSAMILIDNETGDIVAMAGGVGEKQGNLTLNRATQSTLSPGSSIKPLTVYSPAIELGVITPGSAYEDSPYMKINGKNWPQNDNRRYSGWMLVNEGLSKSLNTIAVKVLADLTPEASFAFAKERYELNSLVESVERNGTTYTDISLAPLGMGQLTYGLTVREMATAYASFPNGGVYRKARTYTRVEDSEGNLVLDNPQQSHVAISKHTAWYMVYMLSNAVQSGTGTAARITGVPIAGKTGTTSSNKDRWFSGFTPKYTATVWCGYDDPEEIRLVKSTNPAIVMWRAVLSSILEDANEEEIGSFEQPDDEEFVTVKVCSQTGLLAGDHCKEKTIRLFESDVPTETCDAHLEFRITVCHPFGSDGAGYYSSDYCRLYHEIVSSPEFIALSELVPDLKRFKTNTLQDQYIYGMTDTGDTDKDPLHQALEQNEIDPCPEHNAAKLEELRRAIREAQASLFPSLPPEDDGDDDEMP